MENVINKDPVAVRCEVVDTGDSFKDRETLSSGSFETNKYCSRLSSEDPINITCLFKDYQFVLAKRDQSEDPWREA